MYEILNLLINTFLEDNSRPRWLHLEYYNILNGEMISIIQTFSIDWKKVCRAGIPQFYIRLISNIILIKKPEANKSRENYRKISPSNIKAKLFNNVQTKQRQEYIF